MGGGTSYPRSNADDDDDDFSPRVSNQRPVQRINTVAQQAVQQAVRQSNMPGRPSNIPMGETHGGRIMVMDNDLAIHKESIRLVKDKQKEMIYNLTFTFDALCETVVSVYFLVNDSRDPLTEITYSLLPAEKSNVQPKHLKFFPAKKILYKEEFFSLDLSLHSIEVLSKPSSTTVPLLIRLEKIDPNKREKKIFFVYSTIALDDGVYKVKPYRHKLELNGRAFEVNEIYGIGSTDFIQNEVAKMDDSEKECVICVASNRDTIVLPCRHMCLCLDCAKSLQKSSTKKCPICREKIESFLRLTKQSKTKLEEKKKAESDSNPGKDPK